MGERLFRVKPILVIPLNLQKSLKMSHLPRTGGQDEQFLLGAQNSLALVLDM